VAIPAFALNAILVVGFGKLVQLIGGYQVAMAADAIILHGLFPGLFNLYNLRFCPFGENRGVTKAIFRFK